MTTYRSDIDGLRAVAVLAVLAFHALPTVLPGGFVGVDIFFVISGYLISSILLSSLQQQSFSLLDFYSASAPNTLSRTAVLLDDDMLVHMNWKMAAKAASVELKAYKTPEDFTANIVNLPKDTPIYIDSDLGNDIKGEDIAKELYNNNFTNITMATGHGPEKFAHLPWLC